MSSCLAIFPSTIFWMMSTRSTSLRSSRSIRGIMGRGATWPPVSHMWFMMSSRPARARGSRNNMQPIRLEEGDKGWRYRDLQASYRDHSTFAPGQRETMLLCKDVSLAGCKPRISPTSLIGWLQAYNQPDISHWLGASLESALSYTYEMVNTTQDSQISVHLICINPHWEF